MKLLKKFFAKILLELGAYLEWFIFALPGISGGKFRIWWCKAKMGNFGSKGGLSDGIKFIEPRNMKFGSSCFVGSRSFFTADGGEICVGNDTSFNTNVHINASGGGIIRIGDSVLIAPNVVLRTAGHRFDDPYTNIRKQGYIVKNITIEDDVWIGSNVTIMSGVTVGDGSVIAMNSHVVKNVEPYSLIGGNPAKLIKYRFTPEQIDKLLEIKWWFWDDDKINQFSPLLCNNNIDNFINTALQCKN
jgi:acetyltransferase-like isoleucine patch superfamily enzyme